MDDILVKLDEKLAYSVQKLRDGTHDDHDILPSVFWTLLEYNRTLRTALEKIQEQSSEISRALSAVNDHQENNTSKLGAAIFALTELLKTESNKFKDRLVEPVGQIRAEIQTTATELNNAQKLTV